MKLTLKLILCCAGLLSAASAFAKGGRMNLSLWKHLSSWARCLVLLFCKTFIENGVSYGILQGAGK